MTSTHALRRPSRKAARIAGVGVVAAGLVGSAALVWQASYSAFSATTATPTNNWSAGTVALTDDDSNTALFSATNLKPGATGSKCIVVSSTGSLASTVKLYATNYAQTNTLGDNISLTVTQGTTPAGTAAGTCTGFTADSGTTNTTTKTLTSFSSSYTAFSAGFGSWAPAAVTSGGAAVTKTYKIDYTLGSPSTQAAVDAMQGGTAQIGFTWEAQNS